MKPAWTSAWKLGLGVGLLCAAPLMLRGERSNKAARPDRIIPTVAAPAGGGASENWEPRPKRSRQANEESWPEVENFMRLNSPVKWAAYESLVKNGKHPTSELRTQLIARYVELNRLPNKELYNLEVQRVRIEDDLFAALVKLKKAATEGERETARADLRPTVERLIRNRMDERRARRDNLKLSLGALEKEVSHDETVKANTARFDEVVRKRAAEFERKGLNAKADDLHGIRRRPAGESTTAPDDTDDESTLPSTQPK